MHHPAALSTPTDPDSSSAATLGAVIELANQIKARLVELTSATGRREIAVAIPPGDEMDEARLAQMHAFVALVGVRGSLHHDGKSNYLVFWLDEEHAAEAPAKQLP